MTKEFDPQTESDGDGPFAASTPLFAASERAVSLTPGEVELLLVAIRERQVALASASRPWTRDAARGSAEAITWMHASHALTNEYNRLALKLRPVTEPTPEELAWARQVRDSM